MPNYLCVTCGTQYAESAAPLPSCHVCVDERQYVKPTGTVWTTPEQLQKSHRNCVRQEEPSLMMGIGIEPQFSIGQRALLVQTPQGNFLWDCVSLLNPALVQMIKAIGGIQGIAISHPHYYATMVDWSRAFDDAPIYLHSADKAWVMRPDTAIQFWEGSRKELAPGLTLIHCGGHFAGGSVLHWQAGCDGKGALLTGDILQVVPDRKHVSFMYSYPNHIPLNATAVQKIAAAVEPFEFDRVYGAFWETVIASEGKQAVRRSVERYLKAIAS